MPDDIVTTFAEFAEELRALGYDTGNNFLHDAAGFIEAQQGEIDALTKQLQGTWAIANLLATRLETISSGNAAALQEYDRHVLNARHWEEARRG